MSQIEDELHTLEYRCVLAVDQLLARHHWRLLERDAFVQRTMDQMRANVALDPTRAAMHVYTLALYHACSGDEGMPRRECGYTELFHYLYDAALRRYPDVSEDVTQRALERTYVAFSRCRQPGAFFAFAFQHLLDAARALHRQNRLPTQSFEALAGAERRAPADSLSDQRQADLPDQLITNEQREAFELLADEFKRRHPRAAKQFEALWLKHITELDDTTIAQRLNTSVANVHVLRSRALTKLREDPQWRALAVEFGLLSPKE